MNRDTAILVRWMRRVLEGKIPNNREWWHSIGRYELQILIQSLEEEFYIVSKNGVGPFELNGGSIVIGRYDGRGGCYPDEQTNPEFEVTQDGLELFNHVTKNTYDDPEIQIIVFGNDNQINIGDKNSQTKGEK